jgi:hypothetical protein
VQNADIFLNDCFVPDSARLPGVSSFKVHTKSVSMSSLLYTNLPHVLRRFLKTHTGPLHRFKDTPCPQTHMLLTVEFSSTLEFSSTGIRSVALRTLLLVFWDA